MWLFNMWLCHIIIYIHIEIIFLLILWYWSQPYQLFPPVIYRNKKTKPFKTERARKIRFSDISDRVDLSLHQVSWSIEVVLPASLMISAIQYTLVERLVSELNTSILTPSSMSPQHIPIGACSIEKAVRLLSQESNKSVVGTYSTQQFLLTCLKQLTGAPIVLLPQIYRPQSKLSAGTTDRNNTQCKAGAYLNRAALLPY